MQPPAGLRRACAIPACLALLGAVLVQADGPPTDEEVKAAFLYHFTHFIEWPSATGSGRPEFVVAVLGADDFCGVVERMLAGKSARGLPVSVRRVSHPREAPRARILFVGTTQVERMPEILQALEGTSVLTVGEAAGFTERGGMIGFTTVDDRVRFDINVERANRSGLRISSEVLKLARVVRAGEGR